MPKPTAPIQHTNATKAPTAIRIFHQFDFFCGCCGAYGAGAAAGDAVAGWSSGGGSEAGGSLVMEHTLLTKGQIVRILNCFLRRYSVVARRELPRGNEGPCMVA